MSDVILESLEQAIHELTSKRIRDSVNGKVTYVQPVFVSATFLTKAANWYEISNGYQIKHGGGMEYQENDDSGLSFKVLVGGDPGFGVSALARGRVIESPELVAKIIAKNGRETLRNAYADYYLSKHYQLTTGRKEAFTFLSDDPVGPAYIEDYKAVPELPDLADIACAWTKDIFSMTGVLETTVNVSSSRESRRFADTQGRLIRDHITRRSIIVDVRYVNRNYHTTHILRWRFMPDRWNGIRHNLERLFEEYTGHIEGMIKARIPDSGATAVLYHPKTTGTYFHERFTGHFLSGLDNKTGTTRCFLNAIGQQVFSEDVTIIDDGTMAGPGFAPYDAEGIPTQRTVPIERGVLKTYLHNRDSAGYWGVRSTGNARREALISEKKPLVAIPRQTSIVVETENPHSLDYLYEEVRRSARDLGQRYAIEIDSHVGNSILADGTFTIKPLLAWTNPVRGGPRQYLTMFHIVDLTRNNNPDDFLFGGPLEEAHGICGDDSGFIPIQECSPYMVQKGAVVNSLHPDMYELED